jgi:hypothetical protein
VAVAGASHVVLATQVDPAASKRTSLTLGLAATVTFLRVESTVGDAEPLRVCAFDPR